MRQDIEDVRRLEEYLINSYSPDNINCEPKTEKDLLLIYQTHTVYLLDYICCMYHFSYPISNEIRAILGHLSEYRASKINKREELHNVYGHFRRVNLDALKIICDELDRSLLIILQKQYTYDYRNMYENYLKEYCKMYFVAKNAYLAAQEEECVGSDRDTHNIFEFYHSAAKQYILLKQFYEKYKKEIQRIKWITNIKKVVYWLFSVFGIVVGILQLFT